ncbi:MAG: endonuclease [Desulfovibrionaceae bacterium]|nr:endonuclease [Desulfovibrionaceae bacterium]
MTYRSRTGRAAQFARWNAVRVATGYRSRYEADVAAALQTCGADAEYEPGRIPYDVHLTAHYKPDWVLRAQAILLEAKGEFPKADRDKMLLLKQQYPHLDIRFIFQNPNAKTTGRQTCATWADVHGFKWCGGPGIPPAWLKHKPGVRSRRAFDALLGG